MKFLQLKIGQRRGRVHHANPVCSGHSPISILSDIIFINQNIYTNIPIGHDVI